MEAITTDGLKIPEISAQYLIKDISFVIQPNKHGHAKVLLRILEDCVPENELKNIENKIVTINSSAGVLFKGYIENAQIILQRDEIVLELHLVTTSIKIDESERSYSFQASTLTIKDVIEEAISDDKGVCEYIDEEIKGMKIEMPIIRYKESAWDFVRRVSSRYWTPIFVDETADKPTIQVGVKKAGSANASEILSKNIKKEVKLDKYLIRKNNSKDNVKISQYKSIEVTSYANFKIGMSASYEKISGTILEKKAYLDGGELVFKYVIGDKKIYSPIPFHNEKLHGCCLEGKVVKCEKENVKIQLDIDEKEEKKKTEEQLFFFPWQPDTGNLMYCMPEKDTVVSLYIGSKNEGEAIVINSIRESKSKEIDNPDNKYMTSNDGKRMYLKKDEMGFSNKDKDNGETYLSVKDDNAINFETNKKFVLQADGKVCIKSNTEICANSKKKINIINGSNTVNIDKKFNIYAKKVELGIGIALCESFISGNSDGKSIESDKYYVEIKGATYDRLKSILEKYDLSEFEYFNLSRTPQHRLNPQNRELVYKIRMELTADVTDASGVVLPGTRVSKSIDKYTFDNFYKEGEKASLSGCIALHRDTDALEDASDIINSTGLKFEGSKFVDDDGNPNVFYIVDGELMKGQPDLVVRVSATTEALEISDKVAQQFNEKYPDYKYNGYSITDVSSSNDTYLNEIWTRHSQSQVEELSRLTGISEENIVTEQAKWYNRTTNPDTGTGITLNQGSSNAMGIPEFFANQGRVNIKNGNIYRVEGKERTLVGTINEYGIIKKMKN